MKKLIAMMLLCAFALTSCAGKTQPEADTQDNTASAADTSGLRALNEANSRGMYRAQAIYEGRGFLITYIDFETASERPLCTVEGCSHKGEGCGAIIETSAELTLYAGEDKLFWRFEGPYSWEATPPSEIYVSELDGSNKRTLIESSEGEQLFGGRLYCDGENIYYLIGDYDTDAREFAGELVKLNTATGERTALFELESQTLDWGLGCALGDSLLLYSGREGDLGADAVDKKDPHEMLYTVTSVPTGGGVSKTLGEWSVVYDNRQAPLGFGQFGTSSLGFIPEFGLQCCGDGVIYGVNSADESLASLELASWQTSRLCDKPSAFEGGGYGVASVWGGRVLLSGGSASGFRLLAYDLASGSISELTLGYYSARRGYDVLAVPAAETEREYLVPVGERAREYHLVHDDGSPASETVYITQYAMISKADYWSSTPNYRDITEVA